MKEVVIKTTTQSNGAISIPATGLPEGMSVEVHVHEIPTAEDAWAGISGLLKGKIPDDTDPVAIQRQLRDEWE